MINNFSGRYSFLSNFYKTVIFNPDAMSHNFPSVEHAYQAAKTHDLNDKRIIALAQTPGQAKSLGQKVKLRDDWKEIRIDIMYDLVAKKFSKPGLAKKLKQTEPHFLCEGNYWHDNIWGDCYCDKCKNIPGQNHLGQILMKIRDEI